VTGAVLEARKLTKRFGGLVAIDDVDLAIADGELHAVIGPNGAGKTTLIAQLAGQLRPSSGRILLDGRDVTELPMHRRARLGLGRSFQITSVFLDFTALENVSFAAQAHSGHSFRFWRPAAHDDALRRPALAGLEQVGLEKRADVAASALSHGERRQLEIAMTLAIHPRILLLDEPMAGMGPNETARMVELIAGLKRRYTIVLIEHDMSAVFALADRITVLVYGRAAATGAPEAIRADPVVQSAYLGTG
jgi:branched-chain amino acid transport system ATP-binding protein